MVSKLEPYKMSHENLNHEKVDDNIEMEFNEFVGYGCSATLNGEFYYVGGGNTNKQVSLFFNDYVYLRTAVYSSL